jgi:hypothetical protein
VFPRIRFKRTPTGGAFEEHDAERPNVDASVEFRAL